jgi:hypothetical protein
VSNRDWFVDQSLRDTGFFARRVLGHDYDKMAVTQPDGKVVQVLANKPHGGIRATGPHKTIGEFLDNQNGRNKLLLAPRGAYKSTFLTAFCSRMLIRNRKIRIFYGMYTLKEAVSKVTAIRDGLVQNDVIKEIWGNLKGSVWRKDQFNIAGSDPSAQNCSVEAYGLDKPKTGGHPDIIIGDDLVQEENSRTPEGLAATIDVVKRFSPLLTNGGVLYLTGTRYAQQDLYNWIMTEMPDDFDILSMDAGVEIQKDDMGRLFLRGKPTFAHLSLETLAGHLRKMGNDIPMFTSQYLNRIDTGLNQTFERRHFQPTVVSKEGMRPMTGYLLIDTAVTQEADSCYTVMAYMAFDRADNAILMDVALGQWDPTETISNYVGMLQKWQGRCYHRGELMEKTDANYVFETAFKESALRAGIQHQLRFIRRPLDSVNKEKRIRGLAPRFRDGRFFVNSTVPRTFMTQRGEMVLWDPEGWKDDQTGMRLPGGFLVDCFTGFPSSSQRDIPDAISDMDRNDEHGYRYCSFCTPAHLQVAQRTVALPQVGSRMPVVGRPRGIGDWAQTRLNRR